MLKAYEFSDIASAKLLASTSVLFKMFAFQKVFYALDKLRIHPI